MVLPAVKKQILTDLNRLSPEEQRRAAAMIHLLVSPLPKGTPGKSLLRFAGSMDPESVTEMTNAIREGCEQVDPSDW